MTKRKAIIVDIDGTVAIRGDRSPYDMTRVGEDTPNQPVIELVRTLHLSLTSGIARPGRVIFVSGRMETARYQTEEWLDEHYGYTFVLHMRPDSDKRPDDVIKEEIYRTKIEPIYDVLWVIDDRNRVVRKWREMGLTCLQVAEGDF